MRGFGADDVGSGVERDVEFIYAVEHSGDVDKSGGKLQPQLQTQSRLEPFDAHEFTMY